jgi:aminoglycoside phosphotransferase family enzyme
MDYADKSQAIAADPADPAAPDNGADADLPLARKVAFLHQPQAYAARPARVESIETHMAWVFLTEHRAYKLKKPIRDAFRDFSTPAARHRVCRDEVVLNSRLAPGVYLGVVPLEVDAAGQLALCGPGQVPGKVPGQVVDWLVEMRRLPAALMLDAKLRRGAATEREARRIGARLAKFYEHARRIDISASEYPRRLSHDIDSTRRTLQQPRYGLPAAQVNETASRLLGALHDHAELFGERVRQRRIVDGHGDLRPEHVCLEPEPLIIDCIEFNADLRVLDALSDISFLALECLRLGSARVGRWVLDAYARASHDLADARVLRFYLAQHALSRAKVAIWHLDDAQINKSTNHSTRWRTKALHYLDLARVHAGA